MAIFPHQIHMPFFSLLEAHLKKKKIKAETLSFCPNTTEKLKPHIIYINIYMKIYIFIYFIYTYIYILI